MLCSSLPGTELWSAYGDITVRARAANLMGSAAVSFTFLPVRYSKSAASFTFRPVSYSKSAASATISQRPPLQ